MIRKFLLITALLFVACDDPANVDETFVTLSADSVSIVPGGSTFVSAVVTGSGSPPPEPQFVSRDQTIAQVNSTGMITGVALGTTYVVASIGNARDSVRVRVTQQAGGGQPIAIPLLGTGVVTERFTAEVAAVGNVAYTTTWGFRQAQGNTIKIWNVTGNVPALADSIVLPGVGTVSDIQISDDGTLVVASLEAGGGTNNGLAIFGRANPLKPTLISRFSNVTTTAGVHTVKLGRINGRLYAFLAVNSAQLAIVDITNPAAPVEVHSQPLGTTIHDTFVRDGILFAALWRTGLRVYDVGGAGRGGTPSAPVALGTIVTKICKACIEGNANVHNVWWFHDPTTGAKRYAFVGEEGAGGVSGQQSSGAIHVVDVSDFANMQEVAVYEPDPQTSANQLNAGAHNFVLDEASGILYSAYYNGGVRALDVRGDLSSCTAAQKTADGRCDLLLMGREVGIGVSSGPPKYVWGVAMVGNRLYASDMWNGIFKLDISALKR
jgi:hypothetical protein